jgi:hypothetical protein
LFCQIDGGPENTARAVLAICFLMVARKLTRKIVLTRLLVGHTHEDIDAIFALIWEKMKVRKCMTPQIFSKLLMDACRNKEKIIEVHDIWAVPDYYEYFKGFINPKLGRYAKSKFSISIFLCVVLILLFIEEWTQLQITFTAVDCVTDELRAKYPMGVKVTHRAFAADKVILLKR